MNFGHIANNDNLFRHTVYPISFGGKKHNAFSHAKFLHLVQVDDLIETSVTWERYVPTERYVHEYGCRLAVKQNADKRLKGTYKEENRRIYCGAYQLRARAVRALGNADPKISSADVIHVIENDEISHSALKIFLRSREFIEGTKTAILVHLWNTCTVPLLHICDCDRHLTQHPSADLEAAPAGAYCDNRHRLSRLWFLTRFHIYNWLWQRFYRNRDY